jgi:hypothetical protein
LEQKSDAEVFWRELQEYLESRVREYIKLGDVYYKSFLIAVSGEAADNLKYLEAVRQTITHLQNNPAYRIMETGRAPRIKLLISKDPTYAAAIGVAFGQRINMDSSYCEDWFEKEETIKMVPGRDKESRDEL